MGDGDDIGYGYENGHRHDDGSPWHDLWPLAHAFYFSPPSSGVHAAEQPATGTGVGAGMGTGAGAGVGTGVAAGVGTSVGTGVGTSVSTAAWALASTPAWAPAWAPA